MASPKSQKRCASLLRLHKLLQKVHQRLWTDCKASYYLQETGSNKWRWDNAQQKAFEDLKKAICSAPVLAIPTNQDPFKVECDASEFAVGGTLSQKQNGVWHPVAFLSKAMTETERNYEIYDKELLAIMTALEQWRH